MTAYVAEAQTQLRENDEARPRSQQQAIGWSSMWGCRQALAFQLQEAWESDEPDNWRAIAGTALHEHLKRVREQLHLPGLAHEVYTRYRGIPGHADEVDVDANRVVDWKFPTLSVSDSWQRDPEAFLPKRVQVHGYAAGLIEDAVLAEDACRVGVLVAPVDSGFDDWWYFEEPFDRTLADAAVDRLDDVRAALEAKERVTRDKPYSWCERFCEFFTLCRGADQVPENEPITDPQISSLVDRYGELVDTIRPLDKEKKRLATEIRGQRGVTKAGYRVFLTQPTGTKDIPDLDAISADYARAGAAMPTRQIPTSSPSLRVVGGATAVKKGARK